MEQIVGCLGYFGLSLDPNYNKKVKKANKLVDKYNQNVASINIDKQMQYQFKMLNRMLKILK